MKSSRVVRNKQTLALQCGSPNCVPSVTISERLGITLILIDNVSFGT